MSIDNSSLIRTMLSFEKDDFYFVQILKRRKDNPNMEKDMVVIKNFYIGSFDAYDNTLPQIIKLCDSENARAYFRLNKRNYKALAPHMVKRVVEIAFGNDCHALKNVFDSVAGEHHSDTDKKWIVDLDNVHEILESDILNYLKDAQIVGGRQPIIDIIPTKNGKHVITHPFNLRNFHSWYPEIDVHKDNPTLLYCP